MKICFFLHRFPELSQTFVMNQVLWFLEHGHDVEIMAARAGQQARTHGVVGTAHASHSIGRRTLYSGMPESMVARVATAPGRLLETLAQCPRALISALDVRRFGWFAMTGTLLHAARPLLRAPRNYDAIVAHFGPEGIIAAALREMKLLGGPLATFFHGYDLTLAPRAAGREMYRPLFERGERFLAISSHGADILRRLGADPRRTQVHHMGVDLERFRPRTCREDRGGRLRVLSVGRLVAKKGFADGIDAVTAAVRAGLPVEYRIIGDGPERDSLCRRISDAGMSGAIHLLGPASTETVADEMKDTDVVLATSVTAADGDHEGIPVVLMEALASGVPVIATSHGGIPELVEHGVSGFVVKEHDTQATAAALADLALDPAKRISMGDAGRARVAVDFNADVQNARLETLLDELARTSAPGGQ